MLAEKYRPRTFDDFVGNHAVLNDIKEMVESGHIPHLLFKGPAGTGKTTLANIVITSLLGRTWRNDKTAIEINASDERGIKVIQGRVKDFASTAGASSIGKSVPFKIIFLDEADHLTEPAQAALRRTMEKYARNCRFILACNFPHKLSDPIKSRCASFDFFPLELNDVAERLRTICDNEGVQIGEAGVLDKVAELSRGDIRVAINSFVTRFVNKRIPITLEMVKSVDNISTYAPKIIKMGLNMRFLNTRQIILNSMSKGVNFRELLAGISDRVAHMQFPSGKMYPDWLIAAIADACLECDYLITRGCYPIVVVSGFVAKLVKVGEDARRRLSG